MAMPLRQSIRVGTYLLEQKLRKREKFPLIVELEPLYACNLACEGCGKIQHPAGVLKQRMPVAQAVGAVLESGAPMVSIAGGEPLMHPQIDEIVRQLVAKRKYVFLCTNAMLLRKKIEKFTPSPYFAFAVHIDGLRERHDESVAKEGVFDEAVAAIKEAKERGFRVTTNSTFFNTDTPQTIIEVLNYLNDDLKVDEMMISPAYAYEKAPDQEHFLGVEQTRELFRKAFAGGNRRRWRLNHSPLFLDFLEGKADFPCTAWAIPNYSLFGWQRLLPDERRLRADVQGTDRGHRLEQVRPRQGPALRELHGALRLRADRRPRHHGLAQGIPARGQGDDRRQPRRLGMSPAPGASGPGGFDLGALLAERGGERYELHARHLNHQLPRMLRTIGFDKVYERAEGAHFWDAEGNDYLDMLAGFGVMGLGRHHPVVRRALHDVLDAQLADLTRFDCQPLPGLLAEKLLVQPPPGPGLLRQQRHRGGGDRPEVRPVRHRAPQDPLLRPRLPRAHHRLPLGQRGGRVPRGLRAAAARHPDRPR